MELPNFDTSIPIGNPYRDGNAYRSDPKFTARGILMQIVYKELPAFIHATQTHATKDGTVHCTKMEC